MKKSVLYVLVCTLVIGLLTVWMVSAESPNTGTKESVSAAIAVADTTVTCTPSLVGGVYDQGDSSRVHVLCAENFNNISWFALPLYRPTPAITFESLAVAAIANGKKLEIRYNTADTSGAAWGCLASNCRTVKEVSADGSDSHQIVSIPTPNLVLNGTESYTANGKQWIRYKLAIANWAKFPPELFDSAPDLPPCGLNTNAARTWVNIYNAKDDNYIYGFCALSSPQDLTSIWFAVEQGMSPPVGVYVVLEDRRTNKRYISNSVSPK